MIAWGRSAVGRSGRGRSVTGERALVRRATGTIATLTGVAVAVVVAAVVALGLFLTAREQRVDAERIVREAALNADDVTDPPTGVVLLIGRPNTAMALSPGAPDELATLDLSRLPAGATEVTLGPGHSYEVYTYDHNGVRVTAALDLRRRARESDRLLGGLLPAGIAGILAAGLVGWLVARRAVRPLGIALARQRRFVADASHELRTPLTILHTRAQLLRRRPGLDPGLREGLDSLIDDSRALTEIVNDLLVSAELANRTAAHQDVDVAALAAAVAHSFQPTADKAGVEITVEARGTGAPVVVGAPVALRRAASALLDNALGHSHPGGRVTVSVRAEHGRVVLTVSDNGDGLDPSDVDILTQRFARGHDAAGQGRRFGLGLALVQEVVQAHHGSFALDGAPGVGAIATIVLPPKPPE